MPEVAARIRNAVAEFRRRRVFRVAVVYGVVGWILVQVADATFAPLGFPDWALRLLIVLLGLGFFLAFALAWIYDIQPHGIERTPSLPGPDAKTQAPTQTPSRRATDISPAPVETPGAGHTARDPCRCTARLDR